LHDAANGVEDRADVGAEWRRMGSHTSPV
jgi:hypothetical protein